MRKITGVMYSYSFLCNRKLWFFSHDITMEHESELVSIGKLIDENTFERERKHILIDGIVNIDFIKNGIVYEVKKSEKEKQMAINQIKYYLYIMKQNGMEEIKGTLSIPTAKYKEEVILTDADILMIMQRIKVIEEIINSDKIPKAERISACKSCAYFEMCYA